MNGIIIAIIVVAAIGLIGAILLVIASKVFAVTDDERAKEVERVLPGANCGACGYAGCADYSKAVVGGAPVNQCIPGGAGVAEQIARIMGVEVGSSTEYRAMVACSGDNHHTRKHYEYHGIQTCAACNLLYNGISSCPYGCLGFGDCAAACKFNAIGVVDGVARVRPDRCTGCGVCKSVCPKKIIFIFKLPDVRKPVVMCSNHKAAVDTRRECTAGCIGCGRCEKSCPAKAIEVRGNVARIDYDKCIGCMKCADNCPVKCIRTPEEIGLLNRAVSVETMKTSEQWAIANTKTSERALMMKAGMGIFQQAEWKPPVAVVCGKGNNAGDGFVVASFLHKNEIPCKIFLLEEKFSETGSYYYELCKKRGIETVMLSDAGDKPFEGYGTILDCLLGTGFKGEITGLLKKTIEAINASGAYVVSADINSGLNGDTGLGETYVKSDLTVSIGEFKLGHFLGNGSTAMGNRVNVDIGIPLQGPYEWFEG